MTAIEQKFWKLCEPRQRPITTRKRRHDEQDEDRRLHVGLDVPQPSSRRNHVSELHCHQLVQRKDAQWPRRRGAGVFTERTLPGASEQANSMKATRKIFETAVRVVIRIGRKKIIDMSLPRGSSISVVEQK